MPILFIERYLVSSISQRVEPVQWIFNVCRNTCKAEFFSSAAPDQYKLMSSPMELKKTNGLNALPKNLISMPAVASSLLSSFNQF